MPPQPAWRCLSMETGYRVFYMFSSPSNSCTPSCTSGRGGEKPEPHLIPSRICSAQGDGTDALTPSKSHQSRCCSAGCLPLSSCCRTRSHSPPHSPNLQNTVSAQRAEQRCVYLAGPLRATGSHIKWPRTLYPTGHGATWVGTRPSRLQAPGLHHPGLHGPGLQHSRLQDPRLQASRLQGSRLQHSWLQPPRLQSSRLQSSGISSDCRGKTRQGVDGSSMAGSVGASPLPPLGLHIRRYRARGRGVMPGGSPCPSLPWSELFHCPNPLPTSHDRAAGSTPTSCLYHPLFHAPSLTSSIHQGPPRLSHQRSGFSHGSPPHLMGGATAVMTRHMVHRGSLVGRPKVTSDAERRGEQSRRRRKSERV